MSQFPIPPAAARDHAAATGRAAERPGLARPGLTATDHRAEILRRTAPALAALSGACGLIVLLALAGRVGVLALGGWALVHGALNVAILRAHRRAADRGDTARVGSVGWSAAAAAIHAGSWAALPAVVFAGQPPAVQALLGAAMGTMMAGAFLLAIVPVAAAVWTVTIALAIVWGIHVRGGEALAGGVALLGIYAVVVVTGCLTIERLLARQAGATRDEQARSAAIARLLREYEERGAGWLWQTDANHQLTYASARLGERLGRSTAQMLGHSLPVLLGCDPAFGRALGARLPFTGLEMAPPVAGECWLSLSASPILDADERFEGFRGLASDVTEVRHAQDRIRRAALVDDLTDLPNRQHIRLMLEEARTAAERRAGRCALLFADLDGFKPVNDRFGHAVGDMVLRAVARRIAEVTGDIGQTGRLGGDEFAIVVARAEDRDRVEALGQRLIAAIAAPVPFEGGEVCIGLSIGCVFAPAEGATIDELLEKADIALYQAKSDGRGRMILFDRLMQRDVDDRMLLEADLRQALGRDQLRLDYQPIVDVATQTVIGFEALLRWAHPTRGLVPPLIFVPIAEEAGLIAGIGEWVIRTACADAAGWPGSALVTVNLSRAQLLVPGLAAAVGEALVATRLQPARLELEVTESVFQGDSAAVLDVLRQLRALGVGIALDDFGTGYSSLGYLNRTIFHSLKLDGAFVREAAGTGETLAVIRAVVALASGFGMAVTAEGIESFEDYARMKELGCSRVQGYLFGRPAPVGEAVALLSPALHAAE